MKIIIVGCGKVGQTLAEKLNGDGNDVTIVDVAAEKVKTLSERLDILGVVGNGASHNTLQEAGIEKADLFIAVRRLYSLSLEKARLGTKISSLAGIITAFLPA